MGEVHNIVILTGAGISAESGLADLSRRRRPVGRASGRGCGDARGLRARSGAGPRILRCAAGEAGQVEPNAAHLALARLDAEWPGELLIVTQNVDDLHERAGAKRLLHMHGELNSGWCLACDERFGWDRADGRRRRAARFARWRAGSGPTSSGSAKCLTRWSGSTRR